MLVLVWSLIILWLIYRFVNIFWPGGRKKAGNTFGNKGNDADRRSEQQKTEAFRKKLDQEGEYVDFEEIR